MPPTVGFEFDIFLSHSARDKAVVRPLAERLRSDGLKVWFDEWQIKPGDSIPAKIEEGLERSRVLVLCMSAHAFGSDWAQLEAGTFRFRDPLNKGRRFIPLRLDEAPIKGSLAQFLYINWLATDREQEYPKLLEACRPNSETDRFYADCMGLLEKAATSERTLIAALLDKVELFLKNRPFDREQFHWGISRTISAIAVQRQNYTLLTRLRSAIDACLGNNTTSGEDFGHCLLDFRNSLSDALEALASYGARNIQSGDALLLYAHSQTVHAAINKWLRDHPAGTLKLIFCECFGKSAVGHQPFSHALSSADQIPHQNARVFFVPDSAIGGLMGSGRIKKVFFGAHQWGWLPGRRAWFTNTQGTLAIASTAAHFNVPIFVLVETQKTRLKPSEPLQDGTTLKHSKRRGDRPTETKQGLQIGYEEIGPDEIDSGSIPFVLITEQGEFACADYDLRKRNRVVIDRDGFSATKRTIDRATARSEKAVLEVLSTAGPSKTPHFRVPALVGSPPGGDMWASVAMRCKSGVRMHDLIATMNFLARGNSIEFRQKAEAFRENACEWAVCNVRTWQSPKIQGLLRERFGRDQDAYDFEGRLKEAVAYVWSCAGRSNPPDRTLLAETEELASRLTRRAAFFLRDATLKNQILELGLLLRSQLPVTHHAIGYFPPVDVQWFDPSVAELLLNQVPESIAWETVRSHIWQVDFELASRLTTPEDDFIHVLALEVFSFQYDRIVKIITEQLLDALPERVHETMLFRCFRAWARRLFYHREEPEIFATRYRHESLDHYHRLAQTAAERLRGNLGGSLADFIQHARPFGLL